MDVQTIKPSADRRILSPYRRVAITFAVVVSAGAPAGEVKYGSGNFSQLGRLAVCCDAWNVEQVCAQQGEIDCLVASDVQPTRQIESNPGASLPATERPWSSREGTDKPKG
jgi:hypothetical protein